MHEKYDTDPSTLEEFREWDERYKAKYGRFSGMKAEETYDEWGEIVDENKNLADYYIQREQIEERSVCSMPTEWDVRRQAMERSREATYPTKSYLQRFLEGD